jgi:predicted GTPase
VITCANCGHSNEDDATFCQRCDHYLAWSAPDEEDLAVAGAREPSRAEPPLPSETVDDVPLATSPAAGDVAAPPEPSVQREPPALTVPRAMAVLEEGRRLAKEQDRPDLARRLQDATSRLVEQTIPVVVAGEFKRGKSTLVNALLDTEVCPADADLVTAVPMMIRWGDEPAATAHLEPPDRDSEPRVEPVDLASLEALVSETGNAENWRRVRLVEVCLPKPLLQGGLCLVDTPGVGGLDSAYGVATLAAVDGARAVLFVTDASQELTKPELDFLHAVVDKGVHRVCVVVTKIDIHPSWRRIVALDEEHLARAGLALPVFAVSSYLRLKAEGDAELLEESAFAPLVEFLATEVVPQATATAAQAAAQDVTFVAHQLTRQLDAEQAVLTEPQRAEAVVDTLTAARERTARLTSPAATWQQTLQDGIADLIADVEHDLQQRLRRILIDAEAVIEEGDPKDTWADITPWLQRQVVTAAVENRQTLRLRAEQLVEAVGNRFDLEAQIDSGTTANRPEESLERIRLTDAEHLAFPGGQLGPIVLAGRTAMLVPLTVFSLAGFLPAGALFVLGPLGIALGVGIGHRIISNERKRQVTYRRQVAMSAVRRYVDDASFVISKESRDALRLTQRQLRDGFQQQALQIHRSSVQALAAVERATSSPESRSHQVIADASAVHRLAAAAGRLAGGPAVAVARG